MSVSILIGADIVPTPSNEELFAKGNVTTLFGDKLHSVLQNADLVSLNKTVQV